MQFKDFKLNPEIAYLGPTHLIKYNSTAAGTPQFSYARKEFFNYMAMNIIISVFSTMFNTFNAILIVLLFKSHENIQKYVLITTLF